MTLWAVCGKSLDLSLFWAFYCPWFALTQADIVAGTLDKLLIFSPLLSIQFFGMHAHPPKTFYDSETQSAALPDRLVMFATRLERIPESECSCGIRLAAFIREYFA